MGTKFVEIPALPTEPGSIIRATVRGVSDVMLVSRIGGGFVSHSPVEGTFWHSPKDIDLSTVRVGRVVFDD